VIIDPVLEQLERDGTLIEELGLKLVHAMDTHVHADHVTALGLLKRRFGAETVMSERGGAVCSDRLVKQGDRIRFGRHELEVRETPEAGFRWGMSLLSLPSALARLFPSLLEATTGCPLRGE
jgi:glyoxylase-like metal-dependent hydrolase (beta-lactamase superfamily II)